MKTLGLLIFLFTSFGIAGCDINEGPAEKAGENIDNAVDKTGDAIDDAGDKIRDKTQ